MDVPRTVSLGYRTTIASGGRPDRIDCGQKRRCNRGGQVPADEWKSSNYLPMCVRQRKRSEFNAGRRVPVYGFTGNGAVRWSNVIVVARPRESEETTSTDRRNIVRRLAVVENIENRLCEKNPIISCNLL